MNRNSKTLSLCRAALIAALYVALTYLSRLFALDSGVIQLRLSEALMTLALFTPAAISGLTVGCFLSNLLLNGVWIDIVVGSFATFLGALGAYWLRRLPFLGALFPVLSNTLLIPFVLVYGYGMTQALWFMMLTVGIGEVISAYFLGLLLYFSLKKRQKSVLF